MPANKKQPLDRLKSRKSRTIPFKVCLDPDLAATLDDAKIDVETKKMELKQARAMLATAISKDTDDDKLKRAITAFQQNVDDCDEALGTAIEELTKIEAEADKQSEVIVLKAIGRNAYRDLEKEHPPTQEQIDEVREETKNPDAEVPYNPDTFPSALIAACAISPVMTPEDVDEITEPWSDPEFVNLFSVAMAVNMSVSVAAMGKA